MIFSADEQLMPSIVLKDFCTTYNVIFLSFNHPGGSLSISLEYSRSLGMFHLKTVIRDGE